MTGADVPAIVVEPIRKKFRALYKFHEGSSSAVRKSVKMSTLM
jgi:chromosome transmission fidelity protein 18